MAQNTRTWQDLMRLTQARTGASFSSGTETENVKWLLNSAAHIMYNENPWWERYLVLEPRTVSRGYVAYAEDSYNVYGAETTEANALYVDNGLVNSKIAKLSADGYRLEFDGVDKWEILDDLGSMVYEVTSTADTPPESGWTGVDLSPIVQALSEIGEYIGHWNGKRWSCGGAGRGLAYPDHNGIRVTDCNSEGIVYMAFKRSWTDTFGDGEAGTISDIPAEWFEFMAYHAARSFKESKGTELQSITLSAVQGVKDQALLKISRQGIYDALALRFRTYYGQDVSVR